MSAHDVTQKILNIRVLKNRFEGRPTYRQQIGLGEDDGLIELDEHGRDMTDPHYRPELLEEEGIDLTQELMPEGLRLIGFKEKP